MSEKRIIPTFAIASVKYARGEIPRAQNGSRHKEVNAIVFIRPIQPVPNTTATSIHNKTPQH